MRTPETGGRRSEIGLPSSSPGRRCSGPVPDKPPGSRKQRGNQSSPPTVPRCQYSAPRMDSLQSWCQAGDGRRIVRIPPKTAVFENAKNWSRKNSHIQVGLEFRSHICVGCDFCESINFHINNSCRQPLPNAKRGAMNSMWHPECVESLLLRVDTMCSAT